MMGSLSLGGAAWVSGLQLQAYFLLPDVSPAQPKRTDHMLNTGTCTSGGRVLIWFLARGGPSRLQRWGQACAGAQATSLHLRPIGQSATLAGG